ncbi:AGAP013342-PA-like protein [Anopheles sinensis]|uniref:AGAP013342-PA-like protein n=1 Tax=Anopheles sinensis TaxID=74873 RepID=A0A084VEF4_ANOSI|nr:AGAP013342-PA-like protein [Anopheles sinensis]
MVQGDQFGHFRAPDGIEPQDADLVLSTLRHQRDLFSGPLGIPDVTTRVGSVIHAFETMARQRQSLGGVRDSYRSDKPYESTGAGTARYRSHRSNVKRVGDTNRHKIILPSPKISPSSSVEVGAPSGQHFYHAQPQPDHSQYYPGSQPTTTTSPQQPQYHQQHPQPHPQHHHPHHHHQHHPHLPPSSFSYTDPQGTGSTRRHTSASGGGGGHGESHIHINNNNFEANLPHSTDGHNNHSQTLPRANFPTVDVLETNTIAGSYPLTNENESSNFDSLNLDDDYRKSSFGKQSKLLQHQHQQQQQSQHFLQQRNPPSNIDTFLLGRNHHQQSGDSAPSGGGRGTAKGIWSLFGTGNHPSEQGAGFSTSRNNPNVFFNASSTPVTMTTTTTTTTTNTSSTAPQQATTSGASNPTPFGAVGAATAGSGTMRYYNHDNGANSGNRRTVTSSFPEGTADDRYQRNDGDGSVANEGDNEALDNHVSGDKFLRGTTVSQSFIKNVRIIGKRSSSYDVNGANASVSRKEGKKRDDTGAGGGGGTSSSSNGFKQRGSLMMAAAAKHFSKRNRAPQPTVGTNVADTEALAGTLRPKEDATDVREPGDDEVATKVSNAPSTATRASGGTAKRRLFQPRTMDRAEI